MPPSPTPAIEVTGLRKRYGEQTVLDGLDLTVPAGTVTALVIRDQMISNYIRAGVLGIPDGVVHYDALPRGSERNVMAVPPTMRNAK